MLIKLYAAFLWASLTVSSLLVGFFIWSGAPPFGLQEVPASPERWLLSESERQWLSKEFPSVRREVTRHVSKGTFPTGGGQQL